jgi:hypothetical protein
MSRNLKLGRVRLKLQVDDTDNVDQLAICIYVQHLAYQKVSKCGCMTASRMYRLRF